MMTLMMRSRGAWMVVGVLVGMGMAPATRPVDERKIAAAVGQLGDPNFAVREEATRFLWSSGTAAERALQGAAADGDPEVAARAREILADFHFGIRPDSPREVVELARTYRRSAPAEKRSAVEAMFGLGVKAYPALARLCEAEPDAQLRDGILRRLGAQASAAAPSFLAKGDFAAVEQLLEIALADGSENTGRAYAAYHLLRGQADAKIGQLRRQLEEPHSMGVARALAFLYRAKGDLANATWAAEKTGDIELLDNMLLELGDWKALSERMRQRFGDDADLERLGFLAAYQRLAGDGAGFEQSLLLIRRYADGPKANQELAAKALLLNDRADEAVAIYSKVGNVQAAFELLCAQEKYKEALELAEKGPAAEGDAALGMQCSVARALHALGRKNEALAVFDKVAAQLQGEVGGGEYALIEAERQCGLDDRAFDRAMAAVANAGRVNGLQLLFRATFGGQSTDAVRWWNYFRSKYPNDDSKETLRRMRDLMQNRISAEQWKALVAEATQFSKGMSGRDRSAFLALVGKAALAAGQEEVGQKVVDEAVAAGGDVELGHVAAMRGQWKLAAEVYGAAAERERNNPVALCLQGWALVAAGQEKEGRERIERANLLLLADSRHRLVLAETLERAGFGEGARQQMQLILRSAPFWSVELIEALSKAGQEAARKRDYAEAASYWQRSMLACLQSGAVFVSQSSYILIPHMVHRYRAAGLIAAGKIDEAMKEIRICESILPGDITAAIELVPLLEKADRKKEADELFGRAMAFGERQCAEFPESVSAHNSVAWLLARRRRDLDKAFAHAEKGVALDGKNTAVMDTLAEVEFQRGNRQRAIDLMNQCIALEPNVARHKAALKRVKELGVESAPIE